jgi:shikimate kinase
MNQHGITIFLDVPEMEIYERLQSQKKGRPLLENKSNDELRTYISAVMETRRPFYEKAKFVLKGENITVNEMLELVKI